MLVFDIETDGLLDEITTIHCIHVIDRSTGKQLRFNDGIYKDGSPAPRDGSIIDGVKLLEDADCIAGQNIINFDIPAIQIVHPEFKPRGRQFDTKTFSQVIWTNLADRDFSLLRKGKLTEAFQKTGLIGRHSLEAWGYRLGEWKGDFKPNQFMDESGQPHTWKTIGFTQELDTYGAQDPVVTLKLVELIEKKRYSQECLDLETAVAQIIHRQERYGFGFNESAAFELLATLQKRKAELEAQLIQTFQPWYKWEGKNKGRTQPKKSRKVWEEHEEGAPYIGRQNRNWSKPRLRGWSVEYAADAPYSKIKLVQFNPGSRDHIAERLIKLFNWVPSEFTDGGSPKVDETTLDSLSYPEARLLKEYLMVDKRLGLLDGDKGWLKVTRNGRIHGRVTTNGAVTGRMTHSDPNLTQVPGVRKGREGILYGSAGGYGAECRALFVVGPGKKLIGCDAEGLELRMLAHYMAKYDGGAYGEAVVNGRKEDRSDVHSINQRIAELNSRDSAKTLIYAFLYGAGDYKLGTIVLDDFDESKRARFFAKFPAGAAREKAVKKLGRKVRAKFLNGLPALKMLIETVKEQVKKKKYLRGLDGRRLHVRSEHAALNTLLQSAGAVVMKRALVMHDRSLQAHGLVPDKDYEYVANVHDEFQIEARANHAEKIGRFAAEAIRLAGESFNLRCPLAGDFAVGNNWKETH